jgi:hypothetical protein
VRELPVACSLTGSDFEERARRWRVLAERALVDSKRSGEGVRLSFEPVDGVEAELRELVALEGECCPFLRMGIEEDGRLTLVVSGPPDAAPILDAFAALAR